MLSVSNGPGIVAESGKTRELKINSYNIAESPTPIPTGVGGDVITRRQGTYLSQESEVWNAEEELNW